MKPNFVLLVFGLALAAILKMLASGNNTKKSMPKKAICLSAVFVSNWEFDGRTSWVKRLLGKLKSPKCILENVRSKQKHCYCCSATKKPF